MKKTEEKKTAVKSTAKTSTAKTAMAKKATAKPTDKPAAKITKTTSTKKTAAASAKTIAKSTAKKAAPAAKKAGRKPKPITIDTICGLVEKKIVKSKAADMKETIAVDIEVWGFEDGSNHKMYIEIKDGQVSVMPHSYDAKNFRVSLSFVNAIDFANGKITLANLLYSKDFYAEGNIASAIKLASIF